MTAAAPEDSATRTEKGPRRARPSSGLERGYALVNFNVVLWCVVAAGALLRLVRYVDNRSLWLDESFLALNLIEKSVGDLFGPLDFQQAAPPGFLFVEKLAVTLFGDGEYALRLFPLIAGIAALALFPAVARRFLTRASLLLVVILFAVNEPLIYYSSEVKPYSSDVMVALVLVLLACRLVERAGQETVRDFIPLAAAGLVGVWLSFPAVFVLAGIFVALLVRPSESRARRRVGLLTGVGVAWLVSFGGLYAVSSENTSRIAARIFGTGAKHDEGVGFFQDIHAAAGGFVDPGGFRHGMNGLALLMFAFGLYALVRRHAPYQVALLSLPLVAAFGGAFLDRYPLGGRWSLFLVPFALVLVARGVQEISAVSRRPALVALPIALVIALPLVYDAASNLVHPPASENVRPLLRHLVENAEKGDVLYVYRTAQYALRYYSECDDCDAWDGPFPWALRPASGTPGDPEQPALESTRPSLWIGRVGSSDPVPEDFRDLQDLGRLPRGTRVWFLFSHVQTPRGLDEESLFLAYLDANGRRIETLTKDGASLYLYEAGAPTS